MNNGGGQMERVNPFTIGRAIEWNSPIIQKGMRSITP
jgi:hypothetical protein